MKGSTIEQQQPAHVTPQSNGSTPITNGHQHCNGVSNGVVFNQTNGNSTQNGVSPSDGGRTSPRSNGGSTSPRCPLEKPFLIGVAGGTACGKASVCARIMEQLGQHKVVICLSSFLESPAHWAFLCNNVLSVGSFLWK